MSSQIGFNEKYFLSTFLEQLEQQQQQQPGVDESPPIKSFFVVSR
jgi:hypothetical protein